jgi:hypothetical protein
VKQAILCLGLLLVSVSTPSVARERSVDGLDWNPLATRVKCSSGAELEHARRALHKGDRVQAMVHLKRAREKAMECEREAVDPEGDSRPTALASAQRLRFEAASRRAGT